MVLQSYARERKEMVLMMNFKLFSHLQHFLFFFLCCQIITLVREMLGIFLVLILAETTVLAAKKLPM